MAGSLDRLICILLDLYIAESIDRWIGRAPDL